ncbi:M56 family metallopeptidase [Leeuwenhoekiella parthenopeia]|uniref:M56 family metallopeptidase n=1 Tax=Leeuwenhoekiella parthenopeia TaxID=2890320 RepID=A0ABS8GY14_9FLAO|nr:M56 family metallopeptidase [Leeuwenhoekiella parthenopeia]MCC4213473.1 M56 family metallopeptidase [Leeuwenhoekiella parthenopeia]
MVRYLLEVFVIQALFLAVYQFWLRKETFFNVNRAYLIGSALVAFALPFMQFEIFQNQIPLRENITFLPEVVINAAAPQASPVTAETQTDWSIYWLIYAAGVFFSTGMLFRKYLEIKRYFRFKKSSESGTNIIEIPNSDAAFTFLGTIFLGEKINTEARRHILAHEEVHLKHWHGLDLMLFEVLRVVFWFNPLVYVYQNKVAELHEYIADAHALRKTEIKSYYNQLLNTAFGTQQISFINTFFNHSLIKKRIVMLQKQSKSNAKWKYLFLLPLIAGILTYVGCTDDSGLAENETTLSLEEQIQDLRATLDAKESITPEELNSLQELEAQYKQKVEVIEVVEGLDEAIPLNEAPVGEEVEIIEVVETESQKKYEDVPFAVIEEVPTFPGCEGLDNDQRKKCMSEKVSSLVNENFNIALGKELGLTGINRIYVRFKIDKNGRITDVDSRGPHPKLEEEAIRVVSQLPDMTPGKQNGEAVNVLYSLPIVFQTN